MLLLDAREDSLRLAVFPPEMGAPAARAAELSHHWASAGHEVTVLTGFPNHPTGKVPPEYRSKIAAARYAREDVDGVEGRPHMAVAFSQPQSLRANAELQFILPLGSWHGHVLSRPDVVIATSPQLLVGSPVGGSHAGSAFHSCSRFGTCGLNRLTAVGMGRETRSMHRVLVGRIAGFLYRQAQTGSS